MGTISQNISTLIETMKLFALIAAVDVVVFFDQAEDGNGGMDNSTCWDAAVNCVDDGAASAGVFFMESVNDHRGAKGGNYNLQISGVSHGDTLTIQLNGASGGWGAQNISAPFGTVAATADAWGNQFSDDGSFSVTVDQHDPFGDLFQISVTQQPGNTDALNLWQSSISN